jgi:hypothetical protein
VRRWHQANSRHFVKKARRHSPLVGDHFQADNIFSATPAGTGIHVVFNQQPPDQTGLTIFGNLNDAANTLVQFTSTQLITSPSGGRPVLNRHRMEF